eukprot:366465-Chlamydomonas_euryale.AAC.13
MALSSNACATLYSMRQGVLDTAQGIGNSSSCSGRGEIDLTQARPVVRHGTLGEVQDVWRFG